MFKKNKNSTFQVVCLRQSCWSYVAPSSVLSVYYDKICIKFASHHLLLYVVYMRQKSLNFTSAFKCYQQNVSGFTLAGPPCSMWVCGYIGVCWHYKTPDCNDSKLGTAVVHDAMSKLVEEQGPLACLFSDCCQMKIFY